MNKCKKCNVVILDDTDRCPLCKHVLESDGIPGESRYPDAIATARKFRFVENLVLFISIVAECLLIAINFQVDREVAWSLVIGIILLYGNVVLRMAILGKSGYLAKTVCLVLLAIVMLLGIDYLTGYRRWSLDYVLPGGIIAIDLALFILILINRRNWQSYMMSELLTILLSIVPVVLLQMRIIHFPYLAWGSLGVSVFLFLGTLILGDQRARTELKRRFHTFHSDAFHDLILHPDQCHLNEFSLYLLFFLPYFIPHFSQCQKQIFNVFHVKILMLQPYLSRQLLLRFISIYIQCSPSLYFFCCHYRNILLLI